MFRSLVSWFRTENLLIQANEQVLNMLKIVDSLFDDSVNLFWTGQGVTIDELKERDKEINSLVRDVRKKVLTHLAFSGSGNLEMSLVMVNIVVFIERIGDYTKDIGYLATDYPAVIQAGDLDEKVHSFEKELSARLKLLIEIFSDSGEVGQLASRLTSTHKEMNTRYNEMCVVLMEAGKNKLSAPDSAKMALYLRVLRRVEGHIYNIASTEVNPFHRISFKVKKK